MNQAGNAHTNLNKKGILTPPSHNTQRPIPDGVQL